mmetsp:Transcript_22764/g.40949  ORF Transcript_22764/g.40949 Transcript_22764/m.40949 type:complete len:143 (+) Transcript_22764:631-1059(+)
MARALTLLQRDDSSSFVIFVTSLWSMVPLILILQTQESKSLSLCTASIYSMQEELKQLRLKVRELCIYIHAENMGFGQDEDTRSESLAEVLKQNALGQLGFVRTKAQDIFQQSRINKETKAYQKALMKLEAEIRGRVKVSPP